MKKKSFTLLLVLLTLLSYAANADSWICPNCGKENEVFFCTKCGTIAKKWICPICNETNTSEVCKKCGTPQKSNNPLIGTWQFETGKTTYYLVFEENNRCIVSPANNSPESGTYSTENNQLTINTWFAYKWSGRYNITNNELYYEPLNLTGKRTDQAAAFVISIDDDAMESTIPERSNWIGEYKSIEQINRFDVIIVKYPNVYSQFFIRRLIGFPGETIEIRDGILYINNEAQTETYINPKQMAGTKYDFSPVKIKDNEYFILSDNRNNYRDSRKLGTIDSSMILGVIKEPAIHDANIISMNWARKIDIEEYQLLSEEGWSVPEGAEIIKSESRVHHYDQSLSHYEDVEVEKSRRVLDHYETYYTYKDLGDGRFEQIENERPIYNTEYYTETESRPVYISSPVSANWYQYNIYRWVQTREENAAGENEEPYWPEVVLSDNEREKQRYEIYTITIECNDLLKEPTTYIIEKDLWAKLRNSGNTIYLAIQGYSNETYITDNTGKQLGMIFLAN